MKTKNLLIIAGGIIIGILAFQKREKIKQVIKKILGKSTGNESLTDLTTSLPEEQKPKESDPVGTEYQLLRDYTAFNNTIETSNGSIATGDLMLADIVTKYKSSIVNDKYAIVTQDGYVIPIIILKKNI